MTTEKRKRSDLFINVFFVFLNFFQWTTSNKREKEKKKREQMKRKIAITQNTHFKFMYACVLFLGFRINSTQAQINEDITRQEERKKE